MQISTRFSIAVHTLDLISLCPEQCTGDIIANSVNTNPVVIRRMIGMPKKESWSRFVQELAALLC
ncbi:MULTISPECIES: helix-turn-helix domain-containing protein [Bacillus]|uniref:Uncharacterized protein n=1 Tax=Bacillus sonorensis L12 TaxID=1274524 RepID=M5P9Z1_9BACI|nr:MULTISPECIES: Rrf2 family transcriptional regulator [Bacillus]EME76284.1 hypothetical protein BSONL12_00827 [Bacillus sonorensis L12]TWK82344.1 hypothetical protein CHCC20335_3387 [Bacillus paralicheniformis]MDR4958513.1 Rrf2 family transcriptional regulator [Bacillus sonorensis]WOV58921.1 Rrf2 family transcriptional regulator [Bacillus sp. KICET-3]WPP34683.1 Rrf2 family transcriptional regulator [Bacillus sonorensis]